MFGYVRADKPELRVREYEYYRGVYCGLCRALGKCGGQCARLTLSYDFAFMALVRMAIEQRSPSFMLRRCIAHPFTRRNMAETDDTLEFCASASLLLAYRKLRDDAEDERGMKRLRALVATPFLAAMKRKPSKKYRELEGKIADSLKALSEYERGGGEPSLDRPAEIFGNMLGEIMAEGLGEKEARIARKIGRHVGRWIYIADAIDDYEEDVKKGRFNPLIGLCGGEGLTDGTCETLGNVLVGELVEAEKSFDLLDYPDRDMKETISNIIYRGMPAAAKEILKSKIRKEATANDRSV